MDGFSSAPPSTIANEQGQSIPNPAYDEWMTKDSMVHSWINATLSFDILQNIHKTSPTARAAWLNIEKLFFDDASARLMQLKAQLRTLKKGSLSISAYLQQLKGISDAFDSVGHTVDEEDMVLQALCGLGQDYESFVTSLTTQSTLPTFSSLRTELLSYEQRIQQFNLSVENDQSQAFFSNRGRGNFKGKGKNRGTRNDFSKNQGRGSSNAALPPPSNQKSESGSSSQSSSPFPKSGLRCQICKKTNHSAIRCWHRFYLSYVEDYI